MGKFTIERMRVCGADAPIALTERKPRFSFAVKSAEVSDFTFKIAVASSAASITRPDLWQSETLKYSENVLIEYAGRELRPDSDCFWAVLDGDGAVVSAVRPFGIGLFREDWTARWITREKVSEVAPLFLKGFTLKNKRIERARLYITGLGYFVARLNGQRIGTDGFVPQVSDYGSRELNGLFETFPLETRKSIYYLCYDVKEALNADKGGAGHTLAVLVGNGWYKNREKPNEGNFYYGEPKTLFELRITYADGDGETVISDNSVSVADTNLLRNTLYTGEVVDFRIKNRYLLSEYKPGEPLKVRELRDPEGALPYQRERSDTAGEVFTVQKTYRNGRKTLYDFGQNHSGVISLKAKGGAGDRIRLVYGEEKNDDNTVDVYSSSWGGHIQTDELILSGGTDEYVCTFTVHGFRFCEAEASSAEVVITEIKSLFVYSEIENDGLFTCDDGLFNRINQNYLYTHRSNLHGNVPTDCPHRERRGFLGDGHAALLAAMYNYDMQQAYGKWMRDIFDAQSKTGYMPHTAPFSAGGGGPGFGSGCIIVPWEMYRFYGDVSLLTANYDGMVNWVKYLNSRHDGDYIVVREEKGWCIGEWFNPTLIDLDIPFVNTYFFILSVRLLQKIAPLCGREKDLLWLAALEKNIRDSFVKKYYNFEKHIFCKGTKGSAFFALDIGVLNGKEAKLCLEETLKYYEATGYKIETGIFGTPLLFKVLTEYGRGDVIYKIMSRKEYPGYGHMIERGATTLWEGFEERDGPDYLLRDGTPQTGYGVTHNHPMLGSISAWFFKGIGGLDIDGLGVTRKIRVAPYITGEINRASASKETIFGRAAVEWEKDALKAALKIEAPYSCTADVELPFRAGWSVDGKAVTPAKRGGLYGVTLPAGRHEIRISF
ncbi:alpha-rhamnosidase [Clostridia bacterium]|nr:alpha-rhamnosidase [Clostridia bacterium]